MKRVIGLAVAAVLGGVFPACAQAGDSRDALLRSLKDQFTLTKLTADGGDIASAGAVVVLQTKGLWMYSTAAKLPPLNTYKNGKISKSMSRDMAIAMMTQGNTGFIDLPKRSFSVAEKCWVIGITIEKDGLVLRLYSQPYDGIRYYGELKFPLEKGSAPVPDQVLTTVSQVLTLQPADNNVQVAAGQMEQIAGQYVMAQATDNRLQLNADGTFSLVQKGQNYSGTFRLEGDKIMARTGNGKPRHAATLKGDTLLDPDGSTWVKEKAGPVQEPLRLPSTYVSAEHLSGSTPVERRQHIPAPRSGPNLSRRFCS